LNLPVTGNSGRLGGYDGHISVSAGVEVGNVDAVSVSEGDVVVAMMKNVWVSLKNAIHDACNLSVINFVVVE